MMLTYLATPYSDYPHGQRQAFIDAANLAARLLRIGIHVYSPICHTHPIATHGGIDPLDHALWVEFDDTILRRCDRLLVGMLPGWDTSKGIAHEISRFQTLGRPIYYINVDAMLFGTDPLTCSDSQI